MLLDRLFQANPALARRLHALRPRRRASRVIRASIPIWPRADTRKGRSRESTACTWSSCWTGCGARDEPAAEDFPGALRHLCGRAGQRAARNGKSRRPGRGPQNAKARRGLHRRGGTVYEAAFRKALPAAMSAPKPWSRAPSTPRRTPNPRPRLTAYLLRQRWGKLAEQPGDRWSGERSTGRRSQQAQAWTTPSGCATRARGP